MSKFTIVAVTSILLLSFEVAKSETISFGYSGTVFFEQDNVVGISGETLGEFLDSVVGEGTSSAGEFQLSGSFSWDSDNPVFNSNSVSASYVNAITGSTVSIGSSTYTADIDEIAANSATSLIGANSNSSSGFCASLGVCDTLNLAFTPTGNVVQVLNNANFSVFDLITGEQINTSSGRDSLFFGLGFTDSVAEYIPAVSTFDFGRVNVDGVTTLFISTSDASIFSNVGLPGAASFPDPSGLEQATMALSLNSAQLTGGRLTLVALVTEFSVVSSFCNGLAVTVDLSSGDLPTTGDDVILGTSGADTINSLAGNDTVCGMEGDDIINAGGGNDWIDAGPGNDRVLASAGDDIVFGGPGDDEILAGSGDDDVEGEEGDDTLFGQPGNDTLDGGDGVDCLLYTSPSPRDLSTSRMPSSA